MSWATRLLPARARVTLHGVREDARSIARAFRAPRFKGGRVREAGWTPKVAEARPEAAPPVETTEEGGTVVFSLSGVELELEAGVSILEAGLGAGVDLLFSCTLGGCGACMLQVLEGEVDYDDPDGICLDEFERADGMCLACVGRPKGRVVVEA